MHYAHYALWQDEMHQLLDLDDPRPILIWGNHEVGKSTILWKVLQEKQWNNGVLHIKLMQNNDLAKDALRSRLAVLHEEEMMRGLRDAKQEMGRQPIIILEVPRGVFNPDVMSSVSAFAKSWGFDDTVAKVVVMVSSAVSAMAFDADGRERRFFVPPLTSEELSQKEAIMKSFSSCGNCSVAFSFVGATSGMGWDVCRWTSPCQVEEFLRHHGGEEASTHKSDMIQLTGGNIGVMEDKGHETMGQQPETSTNRETLKLAHISCRTWRKMPKRHHGKKQSPNGLWCKNIRSRSSWALTTKVALAQKR